MRSGVLCTSPSPLVFNEAYYMFRYVIVRRKIFKFFFFWDRSPCSSGWPHYVVNNGLELLILLLSISPILGLLTLCHHAQLRQCWAQNPESWACLVGTLVMKLPSPTPHPRPLFYGIHLFSIRCNCRRICSVRNNSTQVKHTEAVFLLWFSMIWKVGPTFGSNGFVPWWIDTMGCAGWMEMRRQTLVSDNGPSSTHLPSK